MLRNGWLHAANLGCIVETIIVTNSELDFKIGREHHEGSKIQFDKIIDTIVLEPFGGNTAPAITAAVLQISEKYGADALLLVLAADHPITDY